MVTKEDLRDALKALHKQGIQAIADWVPDQLYQLPGQEVVTATRANSYGTPKAQMLISITLYMLQILNHQVRTSKLNMVVSSLMSSKRNIHSCLKM